MSKVMNTVGMVANAAANTAINVTAAAAGGTVAAYTINHDVMNDEDMSLVVGVTGGIGTFCIVRGTLRTIKDGTVGAVNAVRTKLGNKAKKNSTK